MLIGFTCLRSTTFDLCLVMSELLRPPKAVCQDTIKIGLLMSVWEISGIPLERSVNVSMPAFTGVTVS